MGLKNSIPESQLMSQHLTRIAAAYPSTKFVSIRGDMCIANYPDKNIPTLLIYRNGNLIKQVIGMGGDVGLRGLKTSALGGFRNHTQTLWEIVALVVLLMLRFVLLLLSPSQLHRHIICVFPHHLGSDKQ